MARANISIEELQKALQGSGLPMGSAFEMKQGQVGSRQRINSAVGDNGVGEMRKGLMSQLDQIAQMDKRLAGVYSDPTSNLYIENAAAREGAIYGHRNTDFKQVGDTQDKINSAIQERESTVSEADTLYNDLTSAQAQLEAEEKRIISENKKRQNTVRVTTDKKKKADEKQGRTVQSDEGDWELSKQQARQARNAKVNLKDAKAVSEFFNKSPKGFRDYLEDEGIDGKIKNDNLSAKQIKEMRMKWEKANSDDKTKKAAQTAQKKKEEKLKSGRKALF